MSGFFKQDRRGHVELPSSAEHDPAGLLGVFAALKRSAEIARQIAFLTGTDVIVVREERMVREAGTDSYDAAREARNNIRPLNRPLR